ncbi:MAG: hypothetical protein Q8R82_08665 [Hyphomonadaceae bacterium]|nr:hypothetical protein [Hyphomonadaceae bacterium]
MLNFTLQPQRVSKLSRETERSTMLGEAKLWPGLAAHISASHEAITRLVSYITDLNAVPVGITSMPEKMALSWQAAQQASKVLKAARKRIEQEAKDLAEEVTAEEAAYWRANVPSLAVQLRVFDVAEKLVATGNIVELRSMMMGDAGIAATIATTNRVLIHPGLVPTVRDSLIRGVLRQDQPAIVDKADKASELLVLAKGYGEAIKIVDYGVSSATAAAAWESRVQPPVMPEPVAA